MPIFSHLFALLCLLFRAMLNYRDYDWDIGDISHFVCVCFAYYASNGFIELVSVTVDRVGWWTNFEMSREKQSVEWFIDHKTSIQPLFGHYSAACIYLNFSDDKYWTRRPFRERKLINNNRSRPNSQIRHNTLWRRLFEVWLFSKMPVMRFSVFKYIEFACFVHFSIWITFSSDFSKIINNDKS